MLRVRSIIRPAVLMCTVAATAVFGGPVAQVSASGCQGWVSGQPPTVGTSTELRGVAVLSPCNAWAVGDSSVGTVAEQWTGGGWISIAMPNIPTATSAALNGVSATSATNLWAVGDYSVGSTIKTLIEHWSGNSWSLVTSKNPSTTAQRASGGLCRFRI